MRSASQAIKIDIPPRLTMVITTQVHIARLAILIGWFEVKHEHGKDPKVDFLCDL